MDIRVSPTPGHGHAGYLPSSNRSAMGQINSAKKQAEQHVTSKSEAAVASNAPGKYDPLKLEDFQRRKLTHKELADLADKFSAKYDPTNMTQEDYDSFLDDLVEEGILSEHELGPLGYHGIVVLGSFDDVATFGGFCTRNTSSPDWDTYFSRYGYAYSLQETNGNALAYAKLMSLIQRPSGSVDYIKYKETQRSAYTAIANILEAMQNHRKS